MEKGGRPFLDFGHLDEWLEQSFVQMRATRWGSLDHEQFAQAAAAGFAMINYAHPFREGNGRSSRIFLQQCTSDGQFELDFTVIARQPERWNEASRLSVPRHYGGLPDPDPVREIFREIAVKRPDPPDAAPSPTTDDMGVDPVESKARVARAAGNESLHHGDRDRTSAARTLVPPSRSAMRTARTDGPAGAQPRPAPRVPRTDPREHGGGYHL